MVSVAQTAANGGVEKRKMIQGSAWIMLEYGGKQFTRLLGNLILTKLLFPELFGIMALVNISIQGLQMFSDVGLNQNIIQSRRGDDKVFLDTAWTVQVIRGFGIWILASVLAWPVSKVYGQPDLAWLIPVSGLMAVLSGFYSTQMITMNRHLNMARLTIVELLTHISGIAVMILWAWLSPSIWSLVAGGLVSSALKLIASHLFFREYRNHFRWDQESVGELFSFGKWIFISTALAFLAAQGDRIVLGKLLSMTELGVYSIAYFLSQAVLQAVSALGNKMLFPAYSRFAEGDRRELTLRIRRIRRTLLAAAMPAVAVLVLFGSELVELLYDERYREAGWMLQVLSIGSIMAVAISTVSPVLLALGDSYRFMLLLVFKLALMLGAMALGGWLFELPGLILGISVSHFLYYPVLAWAVRRHGVWLPSQDLVWVFGTLLITGVLFWLKTQISL